MIYIYLDYCGMQNALNRFYVNDARYFMKI